MYIINVYLFTLEINWHLLIYVLRKWKNSSTWVKITYLYIYIYICIVVIDILFFESFHPIRNLNEVFTYNQIVIMYL